MKWILDMRNKTGEDRMRWILENKCSNCGHAVIWNPIKEDPERCPACGEPDEEQEEQG